MSDSEKENLARCKRLIEEKFHFENEQGTIRQRDMEYLADKIEEVCGIKLSLSTLKRLWKKDYDQTPHPATLQGLVSVLGYKDWQEFKTHQGISSTGPKAKRKQLTLNRWVLFPVVVIIPLLFWLIAFRSKHPEVKPVIKGPVMFTGNKTVAQGVPNTVIFNYDLKHVEADSFFFQQSWNPREKVKIDPKGNHYSNIYYYPGFHKAKLIANDSIIKRFRVHITTDGWLPLVRYPLTDELPVYIKTADPVMNGSFHITRKDLASSGVDANKNFVTSYYNVREFENTDSDNYSLDTRIICDSSNAVACPGFELVVLCEVHIFLRAIHEPVK